VDAIQTVLERMRSYGNQPAIFWSDRELSYQEFLNYVQKWSDHLIINGVGSGTVCVVLGEFSPATCSLLFALMKAKAIMVPLTCSISKSEIQNFIEIAGAEVLINVAPDDTFEFSRLKALEVNALISEFKKKESPGLVVFSSGSTGKPKGILQDCERVVRKFVAERTGWRSVLFLLMDHFGGFNTFIGAFAYGGAAVCIADRSPACVCDAIQKSRATLLPTTPTFINLLIASGAHRSFDLSSVKLITYGTEVMPEVTLRKVRNIFPNATIKQTYGLSELGVLRSKSESDGSLWVKIGGDGFEIKVVDDLLWVRSEANMVGYLNAPSPFDEDGWMCTGDQVEVNGEYMRILGRKSEMINVGGQKVFPAEVENVLLEVPNVKDATAFGAKHSLMGNVVHARISIHQHEEPASMIERLRIHCTSKLARFKIPVKFFIVSAEAQHNDRFKKIRAGIEKESSR
jgi:long-chain acyl-CoA synthetase